jgi:hypothetical protein
MFPEFRAIKMLCALTSLLILLNGCASQGPRLEPHPAIAEQRIGELNRAILALGDDIDASEARRAARIAIEYSLQLAREYEITDSALVHNIKVNLGLKPRGLCVDWTRDLITRLKQEKFHSLDLHWAIANYERAFRLEHSTVVISARGASLEQGLVLDPWRYSGELYWSPTLLDKDYSWKPQGEIYALKKQREVDASNRNFTR